MSFDWNVESNHNHVANYQVSGLPYTTQKAAGDDVVFPRVTSWVVLKAVGADGTAVTVKFTDAQNNAVSGYTLSAGETTPRLDLRCTKIFTSGNATLHVLAGLTTIGSANFIDSDEFDW
jgi:hypothetical protein